MYPIIHIGNISAYYTFMLAAILTGYFAFLLSEPSFWAPSSALKKTTVILKLTFAYLIIVLLCIQGANYFHFLFDDIPPRVARALSWKDIMFPPLLGTTKVLYGAVFFYPLGLAIAALIMGTSAMKMVNRKTFILFIVLGFTRIGCFFNGCCYGIVSETFGMRFPRGSAAAAEHWRRGLTTGFIPPSSLPVIPTQAISAVVLLTFAVLAFRHYRKKKKNTFMMFVFAYAVFRFLIEFIRDDIDRAYWAGVSTSQWISLFIITGFCAWQVIQRKKASRQAN
ncbi:MAG: prolipoprotein diacylglyceryl transferase [Thermodesulfobacteriota bacterium]|nr:prolipoprotein diacylglyceryl transferase [Thermodesulfobacteriota bacterium]